jgi:predicted DCC family thiol-disulfide oxidoreductase YuxK
MNDLGTYDILLFDGDCGICSKSAEYGAKIAGKRGGAYRVEPFQSIPEEDLRRFGTDYEKCSRKIHSITRDGRVYAGAFSVNHFCWRHFPWTLIPLVIYLLPPLLLIEIGLYAVVARHRHRISAMLGLNACAIRPVQNSKFNVQR